MAKTERASKKEARQIVMGSCTSTTTPKHISRAKIVKAKLEMAALKPSNIELSEMFAEFVTKYEQGQLSLEVLGFAAAFYYDLEAPEYFHQAAPFEARAKCYKNSKFRSMGQEDVRKFFEVLFIGDQQNVKSTKYPRRSFQKESIAQAA